MYRIKQQTREEKVKMYLKLSKKELAEMLAERDRVVPDPTSVPFPWHYPPIIARPWWGVIPPPEFSDSPSTYPTITTCNSGRIM